MVYGVLRDKEKLSCSNSFALNYLHARLCIIPRFINVIIMLEHSSILLVVLT